MPKSLRRTPERHYDILVASIDGVAERWRKQYPDRKEDIWQAREALPPTASADTAVNIIGNKSWTHPYCDCCEQYVEAAISYGRYSERQATVCAACLAVTLIDLRDAPEADAGADIEERMAARGTSKAT